MMQTVAVVRFDQETGKELTYYSSRTAVEVDGYSSDHVRKVIRGERHTHGGYAWKALSSKNSRKLAEKFGTHAAIPASRAKKIIG